VAEISGVVGESIGLETKEPCDDIVAARAIWFSQGSTRIEVSVLRPLVGAEGSGHTYRYSCVHS